MAIIRKFPNASQRRRWRAPSGASGKPRRPESRGPGLTEIAIIAVLALIALMAVVQLPWSGSRPSPDEMAAYDFQSCDEARAAGAAPLRHFEPWYRPHLDRDADGVACEFHAPTAVRDLFRKLSG